MTPTFVILAPLERRCCVNGVRLRAYAGTTVDGAKVAAWIADVRTVPIQSTAVPPAAAEHQGLIVSTPTTRN